MPWSKLGIAVGAMAVAQVVLGCNAILGIESASPKPIDAGDSADAGDGSSAIDAATDGEAGSGPEAAAGPDYSVNCTNYCALMQNNCGPSIATGDNTEYIGSGEGVCPAFCRLMETSGQPIGLLLPEPTADDTLECRVWHANAAAMDPHVHCKHAGPLGGEVCNPLQGGDPCAPFCRMDLDLCTGLYAQYANQDECLSACRPDAGYPGFPYMIDLAGTDPETTDLALRFQVGNTLNCRMYHLENVVNTGKPEIHCAHTSADGGGVCGN